MRRTKEHKRVGWLIDADLFGGYREDLMACVRALGHEARLIRAPQPPFRWDDVGCSYRDTFPAGACVVVHGDIELVTKVHRERRWTPGVFATVDHYFCSHYYCHLGEHLLNRDYVMLPFGELRRQFDFLCETVGEQGRVFVRPDSPLKLFTGQIVARDSFEADMEFIGFYDFPASSLVLASRPFCIAAEWRFVVADKQVVAGCRYKLDGKLDLQRDCDTEAAALAATIAAGEYQPDPVWVIDICRTEAGEYRLLEIGGFSFADLYVCDKTAIADAVSKAALAVWEQGRSD